MLLLAQYTTGPRPMQHAPGKPGGALLFFVYSSSGEYSNMSPG